MAVTGGLSLQWRARLKRSYYRAADLVGVERVLLRRLVRGEAALVINLHRVSPVENPYWPPLHPDDLDELLDLLQRRCDVVTLAELRANRAASETRPAAVLSFDDGYRDFVDYALPILEARGVRVNMNVIPSCVETGEPPWNVRLYDFLAAAPAPFIREIRLPGFVAAPPGDDPVSRQHFGAALSRFLKMKPPEERRRLWPLLEEITDRIDLTQGTRMMSLAVVQSVAARHEVGAHSYTHESMGFVSDSFFLEDFDRCQRFFREKLDQRLSIYAFPNGSYRPTQVELLRERGIEHILLVGNRPSSRHATVHTRLIVGGESRSEIRLKSLGHHPLAA